MDRIDFDKEVIERSHQLPVVVDFWAPWCGPCRVLGPVIEQLAEEADGKWALVKVNTQDQPEVGSEYNIMSIPAVKMFLNGEVIAEFVGALPKGQITSWLKSNIPDDRVSELKELIQQLHGDDHEMTMKRLRTFIQQHPDLEEGRLALAQSLVLDEPQEALELIKSAPISGKNLDASQDIITLATLMSWEEPQDSPVEKKLAAVQIALESFDQDKGMELLIEAVMLDKNYADDLPRKTAIALFRMWGADHELTKKYRRMFDMALY